jgi:hypothetical protein
MRLLCPIVIVLFATLDRLGYQLSVGDTITAQVVSHDLPGFMSCFYQFLVVYLALRWRELMAFIFLILSSPETIYPAFCVSKTSVQATPGNTLQATIDHAKRRWLEAGQNPIYQVTANRGLPVC